MRPLPAPLRIDLAVALGLAGLWLAEVADPDSAGVIALLLMTLPLGWRRSAPLTSATLVAAGFAAAGLGENPPEPLAQLIGSLLAGFSVAAHARSTGAALAGLAISLAGGVAESMLLGGEDLGFFVILIGSAWGAGAAVRRLTGRSAELEARAELLDARARNAAAHERERIARELHDIVSHSVSLMVVQAGAAEQTLRRDVDEAGRLLGEMQRTGRGAVDDLRRMLGLLRDDMPGYGPLAPQPGLAALGELIDDHGPAVRLEGNRAPALPPGVDLAAYRIVQEALTNARKHAPGRPTTVRLSWAGDELGLEIRTVRPPSVGGPQAGTGHGLIGMRERVALYGGDFQAGMDCDDWVVHARLPVHGA